MKKRLLSVLAIALAACSFGSCMNFVRESGDNSSTTGVTGEIDYNAGSDYEGSIKIAIHAVDSEKAIIDKFVEGFNRKYPKIEVDVKDYVATNYTTLLRNEAALSEMSGKVTVPDIFWVADASMDGFIAGDMMMPLNEIYEGDSEFDINELAQPSVDCATIDGELYFMPRDYNEICMYYNKDMFDEAKVAYPTDGMSAEELLAMCEALKTGLAQSTKKNDLDVPYNQAVKYVFDSIGTASNYIYAYLRSFGGEVIDENGNVVYDNEQTFNAYDFWRDMQKKGYIMDTGSCTSSGAQFHLQQAAVCMQSRAILSNYINGMKNAPGLGAKLGVVATPVFGGDEVALAGASGYAMYKGSPNKTAAWLFLKYIVSEAGQDDFSASGNAVPVLKSLLTDENASWRIYDGGISDLNLNHDAYVYALNHEEWTTANANDFLSKVSINSRTQVVEAFVNCFSNCTLAMNMSASDAGVKEIIKKAADDIRYYCKNEN